jgi:hypothetical protein
MATKEQIKKAILDVAGNPESGVIAELADAFADAVAKIDSAASPSAEKEIRVNQAKEVR